MDESDLIVTITVFIWVAENTWTTNRITYNIPELLGSDNRRIQSHHSWRNKIGQIVDGKKRFSNEMHYFHFTRTGLPQEENYTIITDRAGRYTFEDAIKEHWKRIEEEERRIDD